MGDQRVYEEVEEKMWAPFARFKISHERVPDYTASQKLPQAREVESRAVDQPSRIT